jgi:Uma2 family endonuclease
MVGQLRIVCSDRFQISSPPRTTAQLDVSVKRGIYARTGVQELWIVEPETRLVKVYRFQSNAQTPAQTLSANQSLTTPLLPGLSIDLSHIFLP